MATKYGLQLIQQINDLSVPPGCLALWGLGQAGFAVKGGDTIAYIDPYLTNSIDEDQPGQGWERQFPPPLRPEEVTNAQIVFCTHEHGDHTDLPTMGPLAFASPQATLVGPTNSKDILKKANIPDERILVPTVGERYAVGGLYFTALPSAHYSLDYDPVRGYRWLGFMIELNGVSLYHSGDTILFDDLVTRVKQFSIDIACLPINGRDWWREQRNIIGNLNVPEAVHLVKTIGADLFIPIHNDMFAGNRVNPAELADVIDQHAPRQKYHFMQPGELYFYIK